MLFDGDTYDEQRDGTPLASQLDAVRDAMLNGQWWSYKQLREHLQRHHQIKATDTSLSARIRDLRKIRFGGYSVQSRRKTHREWEYRIDLQVSAATDDAVEAVWVEYPRRVAKQDAVAPIKSAIVEVGLSDLVGKVRAFAAECRASGTEQQYIPHPATWFRGRRWEDIGSGSKPSHDRSEALRDRFSSL